MSQERAARLTKVLNRQPQLYSRHKRSSILIRSLLSKLPPSPMRVEGQEKPWTGRKGKLPSAQGWASVPPLPLPTLHTLPPEAAMEPCSRCCSPALTLCIILDHCNAQVGALRYPTHRPCLTG